MADFTQGLGDANQALDKANQAKGKAESLKEEIDGLRSTLGSAPEDVGKIYELLENEIIGQNSSVKELAGEAADKVRAADETQHFTESEEAASALEQVMSTAEGAAQVLGPARDWAHLAHDALQHLNDELLIASYQPDAMSEAAAAAIDKIEDLIARLSS